VIPSLKGIGELSGGPVDIIRALQDVLTPEGTLVMPAFTYGLEPEFDVTNSRSLTGLLTELFRQTPDVIRSWHPTHSVCAWGKRGDELCTNHEKTQPFGQESPLQRLIDWGGKVMFIGVGFTTCSMIHVCESRAGVPYQHIPYSPSRRPVIPLIKPDGSTDNINIHEYPGCDVTFGIVEKDLRKIASICDGMIGKKYTMLFPVEDLWNVANALIQEDPAAFLCNNPRCWCCQERRKAVENSVKNSTHKD